MSTQNKYLYDYEQIKYTDSVESLTPHTKVFKFRSPIHFLNFIEEIEDKSIAWSSQRSSDEGDSDFSLSNNLKDAMKLFRVTEFSPDQIKRATALINEIRPRYRFSDIGDEISVPDYLAKAEHWITTDGKKTIRPAILKQPLMIECSYACHYDAQEMADTGSRLVEAIYSLKLRFPKFVFCFNSEYTFGNDSCSIYVDAGCYDFNALCKMLHPATFRRLVFRIKEINTNLQSGYGQSNDSDSSHIKYGRVKLRDLINMKVKDIVEQLKEQLNEK